MSVSGRSSASWPTRSAGASAGWTLSVQGHGSPLPWSCAQVVQDQERRGRPHGSVAVGPAPAHGADLRHRAAATRRGGFRAAVVPRPAGPARGVRVRPGPVGPGRRTGGGEVRPRRTRSCSRARCRSPPDGVLTVAEPGERRALARAALHRARRAVRRRLRRRRPDEQPAALRGGPGRVDDGLARGGRRLPATTGTGAGAARVVLLHLRAPRSRGVRPVPSPGPRGRRGLLSAVDRT